MLIRNRSDIVEQIVNLLIEMDINDAPYQRDIYLYLNEACQGYLDTFINVSGNSWLNDDHITVAKHLPCYDDIPEAEREEYFTQNYNTYRTDIELNLEELDKYFVQVFIDYDNNEYFVPESWNGAIYYGKVYVFENGEFRLVGDAAKTYTELRYYDMHEIVSRDYFGRC